MTFCERIEAILAEKENQERDKRMFQLHNEIFPKNIETAVFCYGCRQRVKSKLLKYLEDNK